MQTQIQRAVLVYQAGIANVFAVDTFDKQPEKRNARRLMQHAFSPCAYFAQGLVAAGVLVTTAVCNRAGDIANAEWSDDLDSAPFSDQFVFVESPRPA